MDSVKSVPLLYIKCQIQPFILFNSRSNTQKYHHTIAHGTSMKYTLVKPWTTDHNYFNIDDRLSTENEDQNFSQLIDNECWFKQTLCNTVYPQTN